MRIEEKDRVRNALAIAQASGPHIVCAGCGGEYEISVMHIDHRIARAAGGEDTLSNSVLLCGNCNSIKGKNHTVDSLRDHLEANRRIKDRRAAELADLKADSVSRNFESNRTDNRLLRKYWDVAPHASGWLSDKP